MHKLLEQYEKSLNSLRHNPSERKVLQVFSVRDQIQSALEAREEMDADAYQRLTTLDKVLTESRTIINRNAYLGDLRKSIQPPEEYFWWFFNSRKRLKLLDRLDWLFNLGTLGNLVLSAAFSASIFSASVIQGVGWGSALGVLAPGSGIVVIIGGMGTKSGRKKLYEILQVFGVPPQFYAECLFVASGLLLTGTFIAYEHILPNLYLNQGKIAYQEGDLTAAEEYLLQALELKPEEIEPKVVLGKVYESVGQLSDAAEQYLPGTIDGEPEALNNYGRVLISLVVDPRTGKTNPSKAEAFLRLGLQRVSNQDSQANLRYQLRKNLGWSLIEQGEITEAERQLKQAIAIDKSFPATPPGTGMAYCMLAFVSASQEQPDQSFQQLDLCLDNAKPETIQEFKWLVKHLPRQLVQQIDTSGLVKGLEEKQPKLPENQPPNYQPWYEDTSAKQV